MKKCNNCKLNITGDLKRCPLCNKELVGKSTLNVFPKLNKPKEKIYKKILLFVSIVASIIFMFIEYYISKKLSISKYVVFGLFTNYVVVLFVVKNYKNIIKKMNKYYILLLILLIIWYFVTKSLIITTYIIPILCMTIYIFNSITMIIYRESFMKYTKTILLDFVIGFLPLISIFYNLTTLDILSYISIILNIIVFLGLIIFFKDILIEELKKIFNI